MARIFWTDEEENKVHRGVKEYAAGKPMPFKKTGDFLTAVKAAQMALPSDRRRSIYNLDSVGKMLPRFKQDGVIPADWYDSRGVTKEQKLTPDQIRINQLADERDAAMKIAEEVTIERNAAMAELRAAQAKLAAVPSETEIIKRFAADVLGRALAQARFGKDSSFGDELNRSQEEAIRKRQAEEEAKRTAAEERKRLEAEDEARRQRSKDTRPMVLVVVGFEESTDFIPRLQSQFANIQLREVRAREDGRVHVPQGAYSAILIQGIRHTTSAEVRAVYPGASLCARVEAPRVLQSINQRLVRT